MSSKSGRCSAVMWPVRRSTCSQGPGCQLQRTVVSPGSASFSRMARRMVKLRSVTSWASPVVHSFWRPSTVSGRTFIIGASPGLPLASGAAGILPGGVYGTFRTPPRATTCTLAGAPAEANGCEKNRKASVHSSRRTGAERKVCMRGQINAFGPPKQGFVF